MTDVKEKIEMAKEGNVSDNRGKGPKVKSTPADLKGVKQLPDKLKLQQNPKNISSKPNSEVRGDNKQNELAPQTGKEQPFLSKPKPGEKAEEKSELKCKPITSQHTSAKEPVKDAGVEVKIHQEAPKAEKSPTDPKSKRREPESAGGSGHDAQQCMGEALEKNKSLEAGTALPTQGEIIGKLTNLAYHKLTKLNSCNVNNCSFNLEMVCQILAAKRNLMILSITVLVPQCCVLLLFFLAVM